MFRNIRAYMSGTKDGRSTFPGASELWTVARGWVASERLVRAGLVGLGEEFDMPGTPFVLRAGFPIAGGARAPSAGECTVDGCTREVRGGFARLPPIRAEPRSRPSRR